MIWGTKVKSSASAQSGRPSLRAGINSSSSSYAPSISTTAPPPYVEVVVPDVEALDLAFPASKEMVHSDSVPDSKPVETELSLYKKHAEAVRLLSINYSKAATLLALQHTQDQTIASLQYQIDRINMKADNNLKKLNGDSKKLEDIEKKKVEKREKFEKQIEKTKEYYARHMEKCRGL